MAGPPTPPPTTAIEMADEAKTPAPISTETTPSVSAVAPTVNTAPAPASPPTQIAQDSYQLLFPTLANLAHRGDYKQLITVAEFGDLKADTQRQLSRLLVIAPLVLAYLIENDLPPAKHALDRLPEKLAAQSLSRALFDLLASTWEKNYDHLYARIEELFQQARQPDFLDPKLGELVAHMTKTFQASFQERMVALLSRAYTSLPVSTAQKYLGLPPDQLMSALNELGWSYDISDQSLKPPPAGATAAAPTSIRGPSSLHKFNLVVDSTARLEM